MAPVVYTLGEAAKAAGLSKTSIRRAIERGRLSATRREDGSYEIDPAELHRAFPSPSDGTAVLARSVTASDTGELRVEVEMLRERLADKDARLAEKDAVIADLREDRDRWREQATRLLPAPQPAARRRRKWWPWG